MSLRKVQRDYGDFGGHRSKPSGWGNSAGDGAKAGTHTGLVWANTLVDVPAALWECGGPSYWWTYQQHCGNAGAVVFVSQAGSSRKGDQPQNWRETDPRTGQVDH